MGKHLTREQYALMKKLYLDGLADRAIAEVIGCHISTVTAWRHKNECPPNMGSGNYRPRREYAIYVAKTDELVAIGNEQECSRAMGMSIASFRSTVCRALRGERKRYVVLDLDRKEDVG